MNMREMAKERYKLKREMKFQIEQWIKKNVSFSTIGIYVYDDEICVTLDSDMDGELKDFQNEFCLTVFQKEKYETEKYEYINNKNYCISDRKVKYYFKIKG